MSPRRLAAVALAALAASAAGCGEDQDARVRAALERFETATAKKDYRALCRDLLARELVARLGSVGLPCEQALRIALGSRREPRLRIHRIRVRDDTALALVTTSALGERPSRDTMRLVEQDGDWRVSSLSGNQPPSPPRNLAGEPDDER